MKTVAGFVMIVIVVIGLTKFVVWADDAAEARDAFDAVCAWEGGDVKDDVCLKDGRVILTKADVLRKVGQ